MKFQARGMKWLRLVHILLTSVWFGAVVCIAVLTYLCFFQMNEREFLTTAPLISELYRKAVLPVALLVIFQGFIYGFFTNWGFIKFKWVFSKWMLTLLIVLCTGFGSIGQLIKAIKTVEIYGFTGGLADGGLVLLFIALQIVFMAIMIVLSVFKPGKR